MSDAILILNAGSSSIKFALYPAHLRPAAVCEGASWLGLDLDQASNEVGSP